jgi:hypothetical protein
MAAKVIDSGVVVAIVYFHPARQGELTCRKRSAVLGKSHDSSPPKRAEAPMVGDSVTMAPGTGLSLVDFT